jgi:predicted lipoprotein with Yx(FWY)xxD motif
MIVLRSRRTAAVSAAALVATATLSGCGALEKIGIGGKDKATLVAAANPSLGQVLTDGEGNVLYRSDKDSAEPPRSNCINECSSNWIPVTVTDGTKVQGVDPALVGTIQRSDDGLTQVTLAGWPLYRFVKDEKKGEAKGQGIAKQWWIATPDGSKIGPDGQRVGGAGAPGPTGGNAPGGGPGGGQDAGQGQTQGQTQGGSGG